MTISSLLALYLAGILTFASPCVLPMLPIYLSVLGGAQGADEQESRRRVRRAGIGFALGLSAVFVLGGIGASALIAQLGAHARMFAIVSGIALSVVGLKMLGVLRLPFLDKESRPFFEKIPAPRGVTGGMLFGAAFGIGWTPCVGPVLGAALTYSATSSASPLQAGLQLGAYAIGLSSPLVAAAFAAGSVLRFTRKLAGSTAAIHRLTGAALVVVGGLLMAGLLGKTEEGSAGASPCETPAASSCDGKIAEGSSQDEVQLPEGKPRLLEFVSGHCPVCQRMAPIVDSLERQCKASDGMVMRIRVDEKEGAALARRYGVRQVPTFISVDGQGKEMERIVGEQSAEKLAHVLSEVRGEACSAM